MKRCEFNVKTTTMTHFVPELAFITGEGSPLEVMDQVVNYRTQEKLIVDKVDKLNGGFLLKRLDETEGLPLIDVQPGDSFTLVSRVVVENS